MGFIKNHTESENKGVQLYTGVANMKVIAINPNAAQLSKIYDKEVSTEPEYVSENDNGKRKVRLDIFLHNEEKDCIVKFPFWLEDEKRMSQAGNTQFINKKIQSTWSTSLEDLKENAKMEWFDNTTTREAKVGEVALYEFLVKWTNAATGESVDLELDNFEGLLKGDMSELHEIMEKLGKTVNVLLGVNDAGYQSVYNKFVNRGHIASTNGFAKALGEDYGEFKANYGSTFKFQEYDANASVPSEDVTTIDTPKGEEASEEKYF